MSDPTNSKYNSLQLYCYEQSQEINKLHGRIKLLESSGDELLEWLKDGNISDSNYRLLANAWQRAKENKP